jgi:outer membrane lipoprotein-sorting protein
MGDLMKKAGTATLFFFLFLVAAAVCGQAATPVSEQELAENLKLYASISHLEVGFKQTKTLKDMGIQLKSEGKLTLTRPDQVVWEIKSPGSVRISFNKSEIRIQSGKGADATTQVLKVGEASSDQAEKSMAGMMAWLNLDSKSLYDQYNIFAEGKHTFRFEPKQKSASPFSDLQMILGSDGQLNHLTIHELSGDVIDTEFDRPKIVKK